MFVKKGAVIPRGGGGEIDASHCYYPNAINFNGKIYIYYVPGVYGVALAISKDGMNFVKKGMVIPKSGGGEVDTQIMKAAAVVVNDKVYVYYACLGGRIALAVSNDGMNFTKKGIVVSQGGAGEVDETNAYCPGFMEKDGKFYMYYCCSKPVGGYRIGLAISKDGMNFIKKGIVIPRGAVGENDHTAVAHAAPVVVNNKIHVYYYNGPIMLAVSEDGMNFVKKGVVVAKGGAGEIDDLETASPAPVVVNNKVYMYYAAHDGANVRIALAISEDGM